ncbi:hypothetical protein ACHHYP_13196 [Achlya hypogyna]|uniref:Glycosyl transferase family 1 domain-containing protein n=1 Tax=Achlya hypogyna TaxID=1202772 RepID=A0A1V9ZFS5_ACHHY|nr:hypothetical protein ACHHYP_13196 [Achlya hypogyna]
MPSPKASKRKSAPWPRVVCAGLIVAAIVVYIELMRRFPRLRPLTRSTGPIRIPVADPRLKVSAATDLWGDMIHLNHLNDACVNGGDTVIPWSYNSSDTSYLWSRDMPTQHLIHLLAQCPELDVFLPHDIRNHGYCQDSMAYIKYLRTRALPLWVFDLTFDYQGRRNMSYFDLCPDTALLFLDEHSHGLPDRAIFPDDKKTVLLPNINSIALSEAAYEQFDIVLCKTRDAYDRLSQWYRDMGNPRNTTILFVEHTSSDPAAMARAHANTRPAFPFIRPREILGVRFLHVGESPEAARSVVRCWLAQPELPALDIYPLHPDVRAAVDQELRGAAPSNVHMHAPMDTPHLGRLLLEASAVLQPSRSEGFGHLINQARAAGAVVVTTDGAPMNELVDGDSGVLVPGTPAWADRHQLLSVYGSLEWGVTAGAVCASVEHVVGLSPDQRRALGAAGRKRYENQLRAFRANMRRIRALLRV